MASIKILAGDFSQGEALLGNNSITLRSGNGKETLWASQLKSIEVASEENVKKFAGSAGWGAVGGLALGPLGLVAGLVLGGNKKVVTFIGTFEDGRKFLATSDVKTHRSLLAATFRPAKSHGRKPAHNNMRTHWTLFTYIMIVCLFFKTDTADRDQLLVLFVFVGVLLLGNFLKNRYYDKRRS